jgi:hypothetical protein
VDEVKDLREVFESLDMDLPTMYVVMACQWLLGLELCLLSLLWSWAATAQRHPSLVVSIPLYDLQVHNVTITVLVDAGIEVVRNSKLWAVGGWPTPTQSSQIQQ